MLSVALALMACGASALNTGAGKLPVMAYDTYNAFGGSINASNTLQQAKLMKKLGLVDAGYNIFILDDFYLNQERNAKGELAANTTLFPGGMKHWTNQVNKQGISVGAYSSNGYRTCAGFPAAYGNEVKDLETWRSWGWEKILKYDNCYIPYDNVTMENEYGRFKRMQDAILEVAAKYNETPWIHSLCQWGWEQPQNWAPLVGQGWRISNDIKPRWSKIADILFLQSTSYLASDFYQHADLDSIEVGNTDGRGSPPGMLTLAEMRTHFTAWTLLKSHLLISTDLSVIDKDSLAILQNTELIKLNQDPDWGKPLAPFRIQGQRTGEYITYNSTYPPPYWAGNSSYGPVFMIINTQNTTQTYDFWLTENWAVRAGRTYMVRDLWTHENVGVATRNYSVTLGAHDVAALLLTDNGPEAPNTYPPCTPPFLYYQCTAPNGSYIDAPGVPAYSFDTTG